MGSPRYEIERLRLRRDFLAAAKALSCAMPGVVLQARDRADEAAPRIGFTATRKLGNAVIRNRIRRRLREAARLVMPGRAHTGHDYVLIGRMATASRSFADLKNDLANALQRIHKLPRQAA